MTENTTSLKRLFEPTIEPVSDIRNTSPRYAEYGTMLTYNAEVLVGYSTRRLSILGKDPYLLLSLLERHEKSLFSEESYPRKHARDNRYLSKKQACSFSLSHLGRGDAVIVSLLINDW